MGHTLSNRGREEEREKEEMGGARLKMSCRAVERATVCERKRGLQSEVGAGDN
jgi:hypothetical protein